jgi:DNA topoisomerase-2
MRKKKSIEEKYKLLDDVSHVLLRPGRYIGSITPHTDTTHVVSEEGTIIKKEITWNQGLIKLFDEIISNSVDESKRQGSKLDTIKVKIDTSNGKISVWDNGGIPVEIHKEHNRYVPDLIFSELKAGSNFDDSDEAFLTGQNGEGSSLTNIFSTMFKVETCDGKQKFTQIFRNNNTKRTEPKLEPSTTNFTRITYTPDYERLTTVLEGGNYDKLVKRVYDIAGCNPKLKVYLNGKQIRIKSFKDYISLYTSDYIYEENNEWKVAVARTDNGFEQISFVNGTEALDNNSTHIAYIANQVVVKLREFFKKKHKVDVKPSDIKNHMRLFIDATVMNPRYSSQTKEKLITEVKDYNTEINISDRFINRLLKSDIIQDILDWVQAKKDAQERAELRKLNKNQSKANLRHIVKLSDANEKNDRTKCMIMLAEGDSAAKAVKSVGDKQYIGSFPLKGKPLNVKDIPVKKVMMNEELKNIMQIIGLEIGTKVESVEQLRYGKIVMMTDADTDGAHICGLLLNFFNQFWPELFDLGILYRFITPIVKVKIKGKPEKWFYRLSEFQEWAEQNKDVKYTSSYYKGLGTSTSAEFKKYLENIDKHLVPFELNNKKDLDYIDLAFNKSRADDRKAWLDIEA